MKKLRSIGTVLFGILFIVLAIQMINLPLGYLLSYTSDFGESSSMIIYKGYTARIQDIEELRNERIVNLENDLKFNQGFSEFKKEAEDFKQNYIVQRKILPHDQVFICIGFLTCIVYLIAGIGLLIHFSGARNLALLGVVLNIVFYFTSLWDTYSIVHFSNVVNYKINSLARLLDPSTEEFMLSRLNSFKIVFMSSTALIAHIIVIVYVCFVVFYFNLPKVKERFNSNKKISK